MFLNPPFTSVVSAVLGPQDSLQIMMMVATWMVGQPVDRPASGTVPPSLSGQLCVNTDPSMRRTRKGRREEQQVEREAV